MSILVHVVNSSQKLKNTYISLIMCQGKNDDICYELKVKKLLGVSKG